jgi:hypothetical protein
VGFAAKVAVGSGLTVIDTETDWLVPPPPVHVNE